MSSIRSPKVCPKCGGAVSEVLDTHLRQQGFRYRRRKCACGARWNTYESRVKLPDLMRTLRGLKREPGP